MVNQTTGAALLRKPHRPIMRWIIMGPIICLASVMLDEPWMVATQATLGGILIGAAIEMWRHDR